MTPLAGHQISFYTARSSDENPVFAVRSEGPKNPFGDSFGEFPPDCKKSQSCQDESPDTTGEGFHLGL